LRQIYLDIRNQYEYDTLQELFSDISNVRSFKISLL